METAVSWLSGALLLIMFAFLLTRAISFAYFKTKLQHLREVLKELNGGNH